MQFKSQRRHLKLGLVLCNLLVIGAILTFIIQNPHTSSQSAPALMSNNSASDVANPLDQVSSADIALTVARMGSLPETTAITNQSQSEAAQAEITASSNNVVTKPQVVATALKSSADIEDYTVVGGDTVSSIASKFGVTSDSIRWSNNLNSDSVSPGSKLVIPPVNGIVHTVAAGETADSLAAKFRSNKEKIIAYNDAEINGLAAGQRIIIPDAVEVAPTTASHISAAAAPAKGGFAWGGNAPVYGYNGYDYGYCTWYVASQIAVPSNWGNANTWAYYAGLSGWKVSVTPSVGAIAQTAAGGYGHVAIVNKVSPDGTMIQYRDMNGIAGFGRVGYSDWTTAAKFQHYISR